MKTEPAPLLQFTEVAALTAAKPNTLRSLRHAGWLTPVNIGRRRFYRLTDVLAVMTIALNTWSPHADQRTGSFGAKRT